MQESAVPGVVAAVARERGFGSFVMVRANRSALMRIVPTLVVVSVIVAGIYLIGVFGIYKARGIGFVPFGGVFCGSLYIVGVLFGAMAFGRRRIYLYEHGLISERRGKVESVRWSEVSRVHIDQGVNILGPVNRVFRLLGMRTGSMLGTMADVEFRGEDDRLLFDAECDEDEPFRGLLLHRLQQLGTPVTVKER